MYREQDDMLARSTIETWVIKAEKGDPNACPKCDGKVFEAEKMVTATVSFFVWLMCLMSIYSINLQNQKFIKLFVLVFCSTFLVVGKY